jgi:hypothetical protein
MWKAVIAGGYLIILVVGVAFLGGGVTFERALNKLIPESSSAPVASTTTSLPDSVKRSEGFIGPGDVTSFLGEEGKITKGWIRDGIVTTPELVLEDGRGETLLIYEQKTIDIGHVEMISYPQRGESGEVMITVDGRDVQDVLGSEW